MLNQFPSSPSQEWAVCLDPRKIVAESGRRSQRAKKALHTLSASKPRWQPQPPRRPPLPGLPSDPVLPLQPSNAIKSLIRAAPPPRSARPAGPARRRRRLPSSGPPALATASSCARARSRTSIQAFRGLIAAVLSSASLHRRPLGTPVPRARVSRNQARGNKPPLRKTSLAINWGAGKDAGRPIPVRSGARAANAAVRLQAPRHHPPRGPPPGPPPRALRLSRLKLGALT